MSSGQLINFSLDEAAKVESLLKGIMESQSLAFWLLSALFHWLKELDFVPPDAALFAQLIQSLSLALVSASSSSASLATYMQAKRREGVLAYFPSHVGIHFCKDVAASSFEGPLLFAEDILACVIASSREDSHLDAQLSIAKAFKLPIFCGLGTLIGRPPLISVPMPLPLLPQARKVEEVVLWVVGSRSASLFRVRLRVALLIRSVDPLPQVKGSGIFASRSHVPFQ